MADSEVTPSLAETIAAFLKPAEPRSDGVFYLRDADALAANLAAVLESVFVLVPKDQLHQEWGYSDDEDPDELFGWFGEETEDDAEKDARNAAKNKGGKVFQRWVGSWRPENEEQQ